ncbi:hypothetical protein VPNG_08961 [Cytospora leucostoma]|uniref:Uncharacterized protein n=1 Tax=Cytospora leucostoma TaxID=1230097 RepID=A0A423VW84_9PEZI|nr:hypothetical protein VPNG_08961 [Cytospora leucostoma]
MAAPSQGLDISAATVVVEWVDSDGRSAFSSPLDCRGGALLDVYFDTSSKAFFKLRAPYITRLHPRELTSIYLFIPPERVTNLSVERSEDVPQPVREQLGVDIVRLQFHLSRPADFVVPSDDWFPKNTAYGGFLRLMKSLVRSTTITLYVACLSEEQLRPLCDALSHGGVRSMDEHAELGRMYLGRGGRIVTDIDALIPAQATSPEAPDPVQAGPSGAPLQESASKAGEECPPPYPPPFPPPAAYSSDAGSSKKRRRPSSSSDTDEDQTGALKRLVVEMFGKLGQEIRAIKEELRETKQEVSAMREGLRETKQEVSAIKEELRETKEEVHTIKEELRETKEEVRAMREELRETKQEVSAIKEELRETKEELHETKQELRAVQDELPQIRDSCIQYVDRNIVDVRGDMDQQISDILREADANIGLQLDEELTTAKVELRDFITDSLRVTAADIVQRLRDAEVYLDIRFDSP